MFTEILALLSEAMALRQESPPALGSQVLLDPFRDPGPPLANEDFDDVSLFILLIITVPYLGKSVLQGTCFNPLDC